MQTRSGRRSATQSTPRSTACPPRDGTPRWKSERWAIRSPSSSAGRPGTPSSSTRSRAQPASNAPHASPAAAAIAPLRASQPIAEADEREAGERDDDDLIASLPLVPVLLDLVGRRASAVRAVVLAVPLRELGPVDAGLLVPVVDDRPHADQPGESQTDDRNELPPQERPHWPKIRLRRGARRLPRRNPPLHVLDAEARRNLR